MAANPETTKADSKVQDVASKNESPVPTTTAAATTTTTETTAITPAATPIVKKEEEKKQEAEKEEPKKVNGGDEKNASEEPPKKKPRTYKWTQQMPEIKIEEGGIGPIEAPNKNDVLNGRGGRTNAWNGNVQFRELINDNKVTYHSTETKKMAKAHICARIVDEIRSMDPPGRFLKEEEKTGLWWDIGDANAIKKVGQALREHKQEIRMKQLGSDSPASTKKQRAHSGVDAYVSDAVGKALRAHEARKGGAKIPPYPAVASPQYPYAVGIPAAAPAVPPGGFRGARYKLSFGTVIERRDAPAGSLCRFEFRYDDGTVEMIDEAHAKKARGLNESHELKAGFIGKKVAKLVDGRPLCGTVGSFGEKTSGETFWVLQYDDGSFERCNKSTLEKRIAFETELKKFCNQFE
eukprot:CAMPEP_0194033734 /NCGR_PEP_ID=MMETSP0009_2-20130614/6296_1 /TAXON_ID=210454 /ORGANISM="Grammatophora oceanica, Strain CCMP 410" /LENGTH=406 /DNA_ID=CAMNT_0038674453 /DNA_START=161 /DNA_END=1381 /DNA_ORIENTATION=-